MFLHLDYDVSICLKDIVAILRADSVDDSFLHSDCLIDKSRTKVNSKIIVNCDNVNSIYLSSISSNTLKNRSIIKF